jgi:putative Mg2+ transporter-C (MgtC) family protein
MDPLQWQEMLDPALWTRVLIAVICGSIVGIERQLRGKPAGIRTSVLVCLGTMTFIRLGVMVADGTNTDRARVLSQVVTGVGFLGAGVILTRQGLIKGVTSAAAIWTLAAVGAAIGFDHFGFALATSLASVAVLIGVEMLENGFKALRRGVHARLGDVNGGDHVDPTS